jgi:hypothetical protein
MAQQTGAVGRGLSAIQNVARVGGHDFDGFVGQMGRMVKGLKDADDEGQKASYALAYLGIKAKDLQGHFRDPARSSRSSRSSSRSTATSGNKVALVQDALGKGADRYLPLSRTSPRRPTTTPATTARRRRQAEEAEKNINRLKLQIRGRAQASW